MRAPSVNQLNEPHNQDNNLNSDKESRSRIRLKIGEEQCSFVKSGGEKMFNYDQKISGFRNTDVYMFCRLRESVRCS